MTLSLKNTKLDEQLERNVESFLNDLSLIENITISSIYLYGKTHNSILVILKKLNIRELKSIRDPVADFRKFGINTFFITEETLLTSTDVLPIKFMIVKETSMFVLGNDILKDLEISDEFLRLRCEQEIKELILQLKRYYLDNYGMRLLDIMKNTIESFIQNLRVLVALKTGKKPCFDECIKVSSELIDFDDNQLQRVKDLKILKEKPKQEVREEIFGNYMDIVHKAANFVDGM